MSKNIAYYRQKFSKLRVDRARGVAPHKPILLLSVFELIEQGLIKRNQIYLSPELIAAFLRLWNLLGSLSHNADIALPFFHLKGDGFWHFKASLEFEQALFSKVKLKSISAIQEAICYVYLDDELFEILQSSEYRSILIKSLLDSWFCDKYQNLEHLFGVNAFQDLQNSLRLEGGKIYQPEEVKDEAKSIVRDAAFRKNIISIYEYRCAVCGLQIFNSLSQNIVDGAHIKPFSLFFDDRIDNGISLCKNHHWGYDRGWFTIAEDYTLLVSSDLREESPNAKSTKEFEGNLILLPPQEQYRPRIEALRWHRENIFNCDGQSFMS